MKVRTASIKIYKESSSDATIQERYTFTYPETKMDFTISKSDTEKPDACLFKIYGVSKETYGVFKPAKKGEYVKKQYVSITYGYDGREDLVYSGTVDRVIYSFSSGDQILTVLLSQDINKFNNLTGSISASGKVTIGTALELISKTYNYSILVGKTVNKNISIGRLAYSGTIEGALKEVLSDKYGYYTIGNTIRVFDINKSISREITLSMDNGLLSYPTEDSKAEKTTIKSILIPQLEAGVVIKIPIDDYWYANTDTKRYRSFTVGKYSTKFSDGLGVSTMECEAVVK